MPTVTKKIKGIEYLYFIYYDPNAGKKKEIYCGQISDPQARRKSLELELEYLQNKILGYSKKAEKIEKQLQTKK